MVLDGSAGGVRFCRYFFETKALVGEQVFSSYLTQADARVQDVRRGIHFPAMAMIPYSYFQCKGFTYPGNPLVLDKWIVGFPTSTLLARNLNP